MAFSGNTATFSSVLVFFFHYNLVFFRDYRVDLNSFLGNAMFMLNTLPGHNCCCKSFGKVQLIPLTVPPSPNNTISNLALFIGSWTPSSTKIGTHIDILPSYGMFNQFLSFFPKYRNQLILPTLVTTDKFPIPLCHPRVLYPQPLLPPK